jgi:hypothetical protein
LDAKTLYRTGNTCPKSTDFRQKIAMFGRFRRQMSPIPQPVAKPRFLPFRILLCVGDGAPDGIFQANPSMEM